MSDTTTISISLNDVPLRHLITRVQTLGAQIDSIREERCVLRQVIDARLAAGESEHEPPAEAAAGGVDAVAPGAVIVATAKV